jgi:hypothetical protein
LRFAYSTAKETEIDAKGTGPAGYHGVAPHGLHLRSTFARCGSATGGPDGHSGIRAAGMAGHYRTELTE